MNKIISKTILERIADGDKTAVEDCINKYGNWIWKLAISQTCSTEAAENLVLIVFADVWEYADKFDSAKYTEDCFVSLLVHRCLIKNKR